MCSKKKAPQKASIYLFSPTKVSTVIYTEEVNPSPDSKRIKLLSFDNLFPPLRHSR